MAQTSQNADADPAEIERAHKFWNNFVVLSKYVVGATVVVLGLMAMFLL